MIINNRVPQTGGLCGSVAREFKEKQKEETKESINLILSSGGAALLPPPPPPPSYYYERKHISATSRWEDSHKMHKILSEEEFSLQPLEEPQKGGIRGIDTNEKNASQQTKSRSKSKNKKYEEITKNKYELQRKGRMINTTEYGVCNHKETLRRERKIERNETISTNTHSAPDTNYEVYFDKTENNMHEKSGKYNYEDDTHNENTSDITNNHKSDAPLKDICDMLLRRKESSKGYRCKSNMNIHECKHGSSEVTSRNLKAFVVPSRPPAPLPSLLERKNALEKEQKNYKENYDANSSDFRDDALEKAEEENRLYLASGQSTSIFIASLCEDTQEEKEKLHSNLTNIKKKKITKQYEGLIDSEQEKRELKAAKEMRNLQEKKEEEGEVNDEEKKKKVTHKNEKKKDVTQRRKENRENEIAKNTIYELSTEDGSERRSSSEYDEDYMHDVLTPHCRPYNCNFCYTCYDDDRYYSSHLSLLHPVTNKQEYSTHIQQKAKKTGRQKREDAVKELTEKAEEREEEKALENGKEKDKERRKEKKEEGVKANFLWTSGGLNDEKYKKDKKEKPDAECENICRNNKKINEHLMQAQLLSDYNESNEIKRKPTKPSQLCRRSANTNYKEEDTIRGYIMSETPPTRNRGTNEGMKIQGKGEEGGGVWEEERLPDGGGGGGKKEKNTKYPGMSAIAPGSTPYYVIEQNEVNECFVKLTDALSKYNRKPLSTHRVTDEREISKRDDYVEERMTGSAELLANTIGNGRVEAFTQTIEKDKINAIDLVSEKCLKEAITNIKRALQNTCNLNTLYLEEEKEDMARTNKKEDGDDEKRKQDNNVNRKELDEHTNKETKNTLQRQLRVCRCLIRSAEDSTEEISKLTHEALDACLHRILMVAERSTQNAFSAYKGKNAEKLKSATGLSDTELREISHAVAYAEAYACRIRHEKTQAKIYFEKTLAPYKYTHSYTKEADREEEGEDTHLEDTEENDYYVDDFDHKNSSGRKNEKNVKEKEKNKREHTEKNDTLFSNRHPQLQPNQLVFSSLSASSQEHLHTNNIDYDEEEEEEEQEEEDNESPTKEKTRQETVPPKAAMESSPPLLITVNNAEPKRRLGCKGEKDKLRIVSQGCAHDNDDDGVCTPATSQHRATFASRRQLHDDQITQAVGVKEKTENQKTTALEKRKPQLLITLREEENDCSEEGGAGGGGGRAPADKLGRHRVVSVNPANEGAMKAFCNKNEFNSCPRFSSYGPSATKLVDIYLAGREKKGKEKSEAGGSFFCLPRRVSRAEQHRNEILKAKEKRQEKQERKEVKRVVFLSSVNLRNLQDEYEEGNNKCDNYGERKGHYRQHMPVVCSPSLHASYSEFLSDVSVSASTSSPLQKDMIYKHIKEKRGSDKEEKLYDNLKPKLPTRFSQMGRKSTTHIENWDGYSPSTACVMSAFGTVESGGIGSGGIGLEVAPSVVVTAAEELKASEEKTDKKGKTEAKDSNRLNPSAATQLKGKRTSDVWFHFHDQNRIGFDMRAAGTKNARHFLLPIEVKKEKAAAPGPSFPNETEKKNKKKVNNGKKQKENKVKKKKENKGEKKKQGQTNKKK